MSSAVWSAAGRCWNSDGGDSRVRDERKQPEITVKKLFDISVLGEGGACGAGGLGASVRSKKKKKNH